MASVPRRGVLAAGAALAVTQRCGATASQTVAWHVGPGDGRTDPFQSWVREVMQARFGITVRLQSGRDGADLLTETEPGPARFAWRVAQLGLAYDAARPGEPPASLAELLQWAQAHPGRIALAASAREALLQQALYADAPDPAVLRAPIMSAPIAASAAAWRRALSPLLFPRPAEWQFLRDGQVDLLIALTPLAPAAASGLASATTAWAGLAGGAVTLQWFASCHGDNPAAQTLAKLLRSARYRRPELGFMEPLAGLALPAVHPAWLHAVAGQPA